mmetsp:Transcript_1394/g.3055  ORF Transcript_1394/g.3055 Transcript_1394/m.3055 type:complete len:266 (-) Transcript_1394:7376-8173(-)
MAGWLWSDLDRVSGALDHRAVQGGPGGAQKLDLLPDRRPELDEDPLAHLQWFHVSLGHVAHRQTLRGARDQCHLRQVQPQLLRLRGLRDLKPARAALPDAYPPHERRALHGEPGEHLQEAQVLQGNGGGGGLHRLEHRAAADAGPVPHLLLRSLLYVRGEYHVRACLRSDPHRRRRVRELHVGQCQVHERGHQDPGEERGDRPQHASRAEHLLGVVELEGVHSSHGTDGLGDHGAAVPGVRAGGGEHLLQHAEQRELGEDLGSCQ